MNLGGYLAWRIRSRLPRLARLGWLIAAASVRRGGRGTGLGLALVALGLVLGRARGRELLGGFDLDPGEAVTIRVIDGRRGARA
ncbi:MAG TPA: hypothetical protein ENK55_03705 [Actinobacteria bacterium]|nr:hypothetical protein [Actinomycetota bacterium]